MCSDLISGIVWVTSTSYDWSIVSKVTVNQLPRRSQISLRRTLVLSLREVSGVANSHLTRSYTHTNSG